MLDPTMLMLLAQGGSQGAVSPAVTGAAPTPGGPGMGTGMASLGKMMSGIEGTKAPDPKFSGGVSGSGLPYQNRVEDVMTPWLAAMKPQQTGGVPTLGRLLMGG